MTGVSPSTVLLQLRTWLATAVFALVVFAQETAGAAITISPTSKLIILYGYSLGFAKQTLTAVHPLLGIVLPPLASDLERALNAKVEYVDEASLKMQLTAAKKEASQAVTEKDVPAFLRGRFTHIAVVNVRELGPD